MGPAMYDGIGADASVIPAHALVVAAYDDGDYAWTPGELAEHADAAVLHISVLADPASEAFDCETGNAGPPAVAQACAERLSAGLWSVVYANHWTLAQWGGTLSMAGGGWADPASFPAPGVYRWDADPSGVEHLNAGSLFTQWCWTPGYDISSIHPAFLAAHKPPLPKETFLDQFVAVTRPVGPGSPEYLVAGARATYLPDPTDIAELCAACGQAAPIPLSKATLEALAKAT